MLVRRSLVVVAHPDDEILGAGIWMCRQQSVIYVVHLTNGSPSDMVDASRLGFSSAASYAAARRREFQEAISHVPVPQDHCVAFDVPDRESHRHLPELSSKLADLISELRPEIVVTHAYEGGHPDHDSAACLIAVIHSQRQDFQILEFPLYHAGVNGEAIFGRFAEPSGSVETIRLSSKETELKRKMLGHFRTQREMLEHFELDREQFRAAEPRDFADPPNHGAVLYEHWGWDPNGAEWRAFARNFLKLAAESAVGYRR